MALALRSVYDYYLFFSLDLDHCRSLQQLSSTISQLTALISLNLGCCSSLHLAPLASSQPSAA
jgi:hypothetical protein